jgi:hypothetical protein
VNVSPAPLWRPVLRRRRACLGKALPTRTLKDARVGLGLLHELVGVNLSILVGRHSQELTYFAFFSASAARQRYHAAVVANGRHLSP